MTTTMRDQIRRLEKRAERAEAESREQAQRAEGALQLATRNAVQLGQGLYAAGVDVSALRIAAQSVRGVLKRGAWGAATLLLPGARSRALAMLDGALSGESGRAVREQLEVAEARLERVEILREQWRAIAAGEAPGFPGDVREVARMALADLDAAIEGAPGPVRRAEDLERAKAQGVPVVHLGAAAPPPAGVGLGAGAEAEVVDLDAVRKEGRGDE